MPAKLAEADQMTVEEFLAFADARPDGERWELVEGVATMNASPSDWHQRIVQNVGNVLDAAKLASGASWLALPGIGTRVPISPNSLPQPDLLVKAGELTGSHVTDDALVVIEVLSRSNSAADRSWRRRVYSSVPDCQHYVTIATATAEVTRYDRAAGWAASPVSGLDAALLLPFIGVSISLRDIYRWTPIE